MFIFQYRKAIIFVTVILCLVAGYYATKVNFIFDFERFFPQGDEDLISFNEFRADFEDDDNYLLVAFEDERSIFHPVFIGRLDSLTSSMVRLPYVQKAQSITNFLYYRKIPFGGFSPPYPAIDVSRPRRWPRDSVRIKNDERLFGTLVSKNFKSAVVVLKTVNALTMDQSDELMLALHLQLKDVPKDSYHILGRANFQQALVKQQMREFSFSTLISVLLVTLVFWFILRRGIGVMIAILSMTVSLLVFMGIVGFLGIKLDVLSTLFPVIMIIVGVSDVVHLTNKFIDEYERLGDQKQAIINAIREIGLATFLTSCTTAIGFLTLMTSNILPVRLFGITAAMGVMTTFAMVICVTSALLAIFPPDKIIKKRKANRRWKEVLTTIYNRAKINRSGIVVGTLFFLGICGVGISMMTTDLQIYDTLPRGLKVSKDFRFFEQHYSGYRPFEVAVTILPPHKTNDYRILQQVIKIEDILKNSNTIEGVNSITVLYKSIHRALHGDMASQYIFPADSTVFSEVAKYADRIPKNEANVMVNESKGKLRVSARVKDIGANKIKTIIERTQLEFHQLLDSQLVSAQITGTGVIFDKNNEYLRSNLLFGLSIAFVIISLIMALLFRTLKMIIISLIPNVFPLLCGGAMMGFLDIALDAPTTIIFAISFGIAVDDTIHFLSKFKIERMKGHSIEHAILSTFRETGKAIILTSIILFFGFLILLFSRTQSVAFVGLLVATTLISAVIADLLLIPLLIRFFYRVQINKEETEE